MAIRKIRVKNFKSFKDLEVELGNLNILIGANASGKSNFVEIFRFLRDIQTSGLDNAISLQGGEYLRNINADSSEVLSLEFVSDQRSILHSYFGYDIDLYETTYELAIAFNDGGYGFEIAKDRLTQKCKFIKPAGQGKKVGIVESGRGKITISNFDGEVDTKWEAPPEILKERDDMFPVFFVSKELLSGKTLLEARLPYILFRPILDDFISIYDLEPRLPKKFTPRAGKAELEENGGNLAIVLRNIMANSEERRKFFNLVKYLLPFVDDVSIERALDKSLLLRIRETYSEEFLPSFLISDGTINMIALVLALYFGKKPLTIIEEPERNIHPHLISKLVHMMEDASANKQIIVTTHNPEMVKHADPKNLLLISRNKEGFSSIFRPHDKEKVKIFLENEVGIEDLYVDSLLEI